MQTDLNETNAGYPELTCLTLWISLFSIEIYDIKFTSFIPVNMPKLLEIRVSQKFAKLGGGEAHKLSGMEAGRES